jgi:hypothetical protein
MNSEIASYYGIGNGDHVGRILNTLWVNSRLTPAFVEVPYYDYFKGTSSINDNPKMTYSHMEDDFPIRCINCSGTTISETEAAANLLWTIVAYPGPRLKKYDYVIYNCVGSLSPDMDERCEVCPAVTSVDGLIQGSGNPLYNLEIDIELGFTNPPNSEVCIDITSINVSTSQAYGMLSKVAGLTYWDRLGNSQDYREIKKATKPIVDREHYGQVASNPNNHKRGDVLSICSLNSHFNSTDENTGPRYALSMGGVFKLERPGTNQQPVYFAFPYAKGLWFSQGPDMRVYYGTVYDINVDYCTSGSLKITQDNKTKGCEFCIHYNSFANGGVITQSNVTDYIASTDYNTILGYWSANAITVGILPGSSHQADPDNVLYFTPNTGTCTPPSSGLIETLVVTQVGTESHYEVLKPFDYANYPNNQTYPPGTNLRLHVRARFANGDVIDQCQDLTLDANSSNYSIITAEIRGNINDYSSSQVSYQIDVYLLP